MEHVVFFPGPDAAPGFRRFSSLDEAVRFVEHLRNAEGVAEASVHMLTPVPVAFRAYYKVEVSPGEMPAEPFAAEPFVAEVPEQPAAPVEPVAPPMAQDVADGSARVDAAVDAEPAANGKRSLGFFAH